MKKRIYQKTKAGNAGLSVHQFLERLRESDDACRNVSPPDPVPRGIPVLAPGEYRPLSLMLADRFAFAGLWRSAILGLDLLGIGEMERIWTNAGLQDQIGIREEFWETSPPALGDPTAVTLLAVEVDDQSEIYAHWTGGEEPEIVCYFGNSDHYFKNFREFLGWYVD